MASYLTTVDVGQFRMDHYRAGGIRYVDAIDPDLFHQIAPSTGTRFAVSQAADSSYKRLTHEIDVPAGGATASFDMSRDTEPDWDFVFVEAHTVGAERLDDAARRQRAHHPGHGQLLRAVAGHAPVHLRPLPDRRPGSRHLPTHGRHRGLVGGHRRQ